MNEAERGPLHMSRHAYKYTHITMGGTKKRESEVEIGPFRFFILFISSIRLTGFGRRLPSIHPIRRPADTH